MSRDIRRKEKAFSDRETIEGVLRTAPFMTLAMVDAGAPYLVSMNHGYDAESRAIYFHCAPEGRKFEILNADPRVWGQVIIDGGYIIGECDHRYCSVHFSGQVTWLESAEEKSHALEVMIHQLDPDPQHVKEKHMTPAAVKRIAVGRIDIQQWSGKRSFEPELKS